MNNEKPFNAKEIAIQKDFKFTIDDFVLYNTRDLASCIQEYPEHTQIRLFP